MVVKSLETRPGRLLDWRDSERWDAGFLGGDQVRSKETSPLMTG